MISTQQQDVLAEVCVRHTQKNMLMRTYLRGHITQHRISMMCGFCLG